MNSKTLGIIFCIIGFIGVSIAYISGIMSKDTAYYEMTMVANCIQAVGLVFFYKK